MEVSATILNWFTGGIVAESVERLLDDGVSEIIVLNNGCPGDYKSDHPKVLVIDTQYNLGFTRAKNILHKLTKINVTFVLNGDILYVPGTIEAYRNILSFHKDDVFCVGMFDFTYQKSAGHNGVQDMSKADTQMPKEFLYAGGIPVSWLHYGLYMPYALKIFTLPEEFPFDRPGHGYEDDWHYREITQSWDANRSSLKGVLQSVAVNAPIFFHDREIPAKALQSYQGEKIDSGTRYKAFREKFGYPNWADLWKEGKINLEVYDANHRHINL